jgi:hypothetical protein
MAIEVVTARPAALLSSIKKGIDENKIQTWAYDADGDFTHSAQQWNRQAWLRPSIQSGMLMFGIIAPKGKTISTEVYGIYHGRFIEMLLAHFDSSFSDATASAMPVAADLVSA